MSEAYTIHNKVLLADSAISFKKIVNQWRCGRSQLVLRQVCTTLHKTPLNRL